MIIYNVVYNLFITIYDDINMKFYYYAVIKITDVIK